MRCGLSIMIRIFRMLCERPFITQTNCSMDSLRDVLQPPSPTIWRAGIDTVGFESLAPSTYWTFTTTFELSHQYAVSKSMLI